MSMVDVRHKTVDVVYSVEGYATLALGRGRGGEREGMDEERGATVEGGDGWNRRRGGGRGRGGDV